MRKGSKCPRGNTLKSRITARILEGIKDPDERIVTSLVLRTWATRPAAFWRRIADLRDRIEAQLALAGDKSAALVIAVDGTEMRLASGADATQLVASKKYRLGTPGEAQSWWHGRAAAEAEDVPYPPAQKRIF